MNAGRKVVFLLDVRCQEGIVAWSGVGAQIHNDCELSPCSRSSDDLDGFVERMEGKLLRSVVGIGTALG